MVVSTVTNGVGGAERDSITKIKFNAPRNYQAQNRAVTINDYKRLLERDYPAAESIVAWGGEDNDPPVYGKVYLAVKLLILYLGIEISYQLHQKLLTQTICMSQSHLQ